MAVSKQAKKDVKQSAANNKTRVRKLAYKDKKKSVKINEPIPSSFKILSASLRQIWLNKKLFFTIMLVYTFLYLLLVKGLATNFQLPDTKQAIEDAGAGGDNIAVGTALLGSLFGTLGASSSESAAVYQVILFLIISLVLIWALRQTYNSNSKITAKQSFYSSMYPFVPYVLVCLVICLQLIPALIGLTVYSLVSANGIAVGALENILWLALTLIFVSASIFMVSSSLFATYIVSLPNMTPMLSLRKAKKVVKFRRFAIIRKVVFFPIIVILIAALLFFPLVIYLTIVAEFIFVLFTVALILFGHAYFYNLYKTLI